jgi:hypothetical protein
MQDVPRQKTAADRELAHLLRNYPRARANDTAQEIFAMNPPRTLARLAIQLHGAPLQCAEIGSTAPNAYTRSFHDNSRLVMLNSGLVDFARAVSRVLLANTVLQIGNEPLQRAALSPASAAERLADLYTAWKSGGIWREEPLQATPPDLQAAAEADAELITKAALLFTLSHELGHAVLHAEKLSAEKPPTELSPADELQADNFGISLAMTGWGEAGNKNWRAAAAGAMISLRIFSGLERLGHVFPGNHPPPNQRLDKLRENLRELCVTEEGYYHITTIALAQEESMESAELLISGAGSKTEQTPERIVSGFCARLEEAQKSGWPRERLAAELDERIGDATDMVLAAAGQVMGRILSPRSPWYGESENRREMVALLASLMPTFPPSLSHAYAYPQAAFQQT